ncbi:MAG: hypothetical protein PVG22_12105 [Chromatiales bacterium]
MNKKINRLQSKGVSYGLPWSPIVNPAVGGCLPNMGANKGESRMN